MRLDSLQKTNRLCKSQDFLKIIQQGKKIRSHHMSMFYLKNHEQKYRIGISVSKKVSKLAVVRNKIKRQISAIIDKDFKKDLYIDLVIIPKNTIKDITFNELSKEINSCFKKF